jgi:hypothetical protein
MRGQRVQRIGGRDRRPVGLLEQRARIHRQSA